MIKKAISGQTAENEIPYYKENLKTLSDFLFFPEFNMISISRFFSFSQSLQYLSSLNLVYLEPYIRDSSIVLNK